MYYYAFIDPETSVCLNIEIWDMPMEESNPYYIPLDSYDESLIIRKKYVNGVWINTTADEAANGELKAIIYKRYTDTNPTVFIPDRVVMSGAYGTGAPPKTGTLAKGMIYFQIVS